MCLLASTVVLIVALLPLLANGGGPPSLVAVFDAGKHPFDPIAAALCGMSTRAVLGSRLARLHRSGRAI
jgi:hypothetical protein